jgi:hypothetical protein
LAERLIEAILLQSNEQTTLIKPHDARAALAATQGNMRDAIFRLYDLYEERWQCITHDA